MDLNYRLTLNSFQENGKLGMFLRAKKIPCIWEAYFRYMHGAGAKNFDGIFFEQN